MPKPTRQPAILAVSRGQETKAIYSSRAADPELARLKLEKIGDRIAGDTRDLNPAQVEALAESISICGLISPLAVDNQGRLLAGGHRRAALRLLQERDLPRFNDLFPGGVPCRRYDFDSAEDREAALRVEIAENEKRRNYSRQEIWGMAERLEAQGFSRARGTNAKPLIKTLSDAFGVNRSTIQRLLETRPNAATASLEPSAPKYRSVTLPAPLVDKLRAIATAQDRTLQDVLWEFALSYD